MAAAAGDGATSVSRATADAGVATIPRLVLQMLLGVGVWKMLWMALQLVPQMEL